LPIDLAPERAPEIRSCRSPIITFSPYQNVVLATI
jgi:hypothetical protein